MKFTYNTNVFTNNDAISYYLLGCFITDGCVFNKRKDYGFSFYTKDLDWVNEIKNIICPEIKIRFDKGCYTLTGCNKIITDWLMKNECVPRKSLSVKFPKIPDEFIFDFLRGAIDGDGSIEFSNKTGKHKKNVSICSASLYFINGLKNILNELDISYYYYEDKRINRINSIRGKQFISKNTLHILKIQNRHSYKLCKLLYINNDCVKLQRKADNAFKIISHFENKGLTLENHKTHKFRGDYSEKTKVLSYDIQIIIDLWNAHPEEQVPKVEFYRKRIKDQYKISETTFSRILKKYL